MMSVTSINDTDGFSVKYKFESAQERDRFMKLAEVLKGKLIAEQKAIQEAVAELEQKTLDELAGVINEPDPDSTEAGEMRFLSPQEELERRLKKADEAGVTPGTHIAV